jgi:hypothetical protein
MRILNEGDKSKAFCRKCDVIRPIVYSYREFTLDSGRKVQNVLQGVCQTCGTAITIPAQSTPKIQEAIQQKSLPLEIRLPAILEDVLYSIGHNSHLEKTVTLKCLIQFYSNKIDNENNGAIRKFIMGVKARTPSWLGSKSSRLSMKISVPFADRMDAVSEKLSLNKSDLITGILVRAKGDLLENANGREAKKFYESVQLFQDAG